jgi:hypothetical protein
MCAVLMIIAEVVREPLSPVVLVEHDHMVEAFAADGNAISTIAAMLEPG